MTSPSPTAPVGEAVAAAAELLGPRARHHVPVGPLTTYRVGGAADLFVEARDGDDLEAVRRAVAATGVPVLVLGKGSNVLVADAGVRGLVLTLGEPFASVEVDGTIVRAGGALSLPVLARHTARSGLTGLEWAVGVPGSVGGGVRMNAGGHGSDVAASLRSARVARLADPHGPLLRCLDASVLQLGYRRSVLRATDVVVEATFALASGDPQASGKVVAEVVRWRRAHQPGGQNAGSVFTNPPGDAAGRLVEAAGLRGHRLGTAAVSAKHANFIQADQGGSADDVARLIAYVRRVVEERCAVRLVPELRLVGFDEGSTLSEG